MVSMRPKKPKCSTSVLVSMVRILRMISVVAVLEGGINDHWCHPNSMKDKAATMPNTTQVTLPAYIVIDISDNNDNNFIKLLLVVLLL